MMSKKRRWMAGIGVAAMIGAALWMRELASWRPVLVGKVNDELSELRFSSDGRLLFALIPAEALNGVVVNLEDFSVDSSWESVQNFDKNHVRQSYPLTWFDASKKQFLFSPERGRTTILALKVRDETERMCFEEGWVKTAWSKSLGEVYGETNGAIWIWDWQSGKLKKRVRYGSPTGRSAVFSPDAKSLLVRETMASGNSHISLVEVRSGKLLASVRPDPDCDSKGDSIGFSPDGHSVWFVQTVGKPLNFHVIDASDFKPLWNATSSGPVKWLLDGRVGILQNEGFSWRDATGQEIQKLRGPFQKADSSLSHVNDWVLSPDGKWIYACEQSGTIRRWRAK